MLVVHVVAAALVLALAGGLLAAALRRGLDDLGTVAALVALLGAPVLLIVAGESGWPLPLHVAAFAALALWPARHAERERWGAFERDFRDDADAWAASHRL